MSNLTRGGVCYDLAESPFTVQIDSLKYHFSSEINLNKFINKKNGHRERITDSLSKRFGFEVKNDILADIVLYKTIEKRGFLIAENGVHIKCVRNITLDGNKVIVKS